MRNNSAFIYTLVASIVGVIIGWLLSSVNRWWDNRKEIKDFKKGLKAELHVAKVMFTFLAVQLPRNAGARKLETYRWAIGILSGCENELTEREKSLLNLWQKLVETGNIEQALKILDAENEAESYPLDKIKTPFLESKISNLPKINQKLSNLILTIYRRINSFNEHTKIHNKYFFMTFDSSLSPKNGRIVVNNFEKSHENSAVQAKILVEEITQVENLLSNKK